MSALKTKKVVQIFSQKGFYRDNTAPRSFPDQSSDIALCEFLLFSGIQHWSFKKMEQNAP